MASGPPGWWTTSARMTPDSPTRQLGGRRPPSTPLLDREGERRRDPRQGHASKHLSNGPLASVVSGTTTGAGPAGGSRERCISPACPEQRGSSCAGSAGASTSRGAHHQKAGRRRRLRGIAQGSGSQGSPQGPFGRIEDAPLADCPFKTGWGTCPARTATVQRPYLRSHGRYRPA
jgi:hypothetical protein